ncbi:MAG TPA: DUF4142 domain-containing protein [Rhodanobacteraceae bacterium]|jgi:putative membrane protein|nr:DUF4142 domain-containing protein [Rhodanobacteraceae bacterium]
MSKFVAQRLAIPSVLAVAILMAAGCSQNGQGNYNNPATGSTAAPAPSATPPASPLNTPAYPPAGNAGTTMAHGTTSMAPATASTSAAASTGNFAAKAARGGMLEIKLADLALSHSHDADVESFARKMKQDHTSIDNKLKEAVQSGSQPLPSDLNDEQQQTVASLESKNGHDFDKAYADTMVKDHQQAVSLFESASNGASTQQLRDFASQALPTLKEHLQLAQQLQSKVQGEK